MLDTTKRTLATLTAATFLGAGSWAVSANQNSSSGGTTATQAATAQAQQGGRGFGRHGMMGTAATDAELAKITAAVSAKMSGATVDRAMKAPDGTFHAHAVKSDGTHVHVTLDASFAVTATQERAGGPGRMGGAAATDAELDKITTAVTAKLAGATVERAMKAPDGTFHAHAVKSDGSHAHVTLNAQFAVTAVEDAPGRPGKMGRMGTAATAAQLAKIKSAVSAKLPGATVEHAAKLTDGTFVAHAVKKDGTHAHVTLNAQFAVTAVADRPARGFGRGGMMGTPATDAELAKITAAVSAKISGATVDRAFKAPDGSFHAHVTKTDGTHVHVTLDDDLNVTATEDRQGRGGHGFGRP